MLFRNQIKTYDSPFTRKEIITPSYLMDKISQDGEEIISKVLTDSFIAAYNGIASNDYSIIREGVGDMLKSAWEWFKSMIKRIGEFIKNTFHYIMSYIVDFEKFIDKYKENASKIKEFEIQGHIYTIDNSPIDDGSIKKIVNDFNETLPKIKTMSEKDILSQIRTDRGKEAMGRLRGKLLGVDSIIVSERFNEALRKKFRNGKLTTQTIRVNESVINDYIESFKQHKSIIDDVKEEGYNVQSCLNEMADFFKNMPHYDATSSTKKNIRTYSIDADSKKGEFKADENSPDDYSTKYYQNLTAYYNYCYRVCKDVASMYTRAYAAKVEALKESISFYKSTIRKALSPFAEKDVSKESFETFEKEIMVNESTDYSILLNDTAYDSILENYFELMNEYWYELTTWAKSIRRGYVLYESLINDGKREFYKADYDADREKYMRMLVYKEIDVTKLGWPPMGPQPMIFIGDDDYRFRCEIIVVNDEGKILVNNKKPFVFPYSFPGGGIDKGETIEEASTRECMEEARIIAKDVKFTNVVYFCKFIKKVLQTGVVTFVSVGQYTGRYTGHIDEADQDSFIDNEEWVDINEIELGEPHRIALERYLNTSIERESSGIISLDKIKVLFEDVEIKDDSNGKQSFFSKLIQFIRTIVAKFIDKASNLFNSQKEWFEKYSDKIDKVDADALSQMKITIHNYDKVHYQLPNPSTNPKDLKNRQSKQVESFEKVAKLMHPDICRLSNSGDIIDGTKIYFRGGPNTKTITEGAAIKVELQNMRNYCKSYTETAQEIKDYIDKLTEEMEKSDEAYNNEAEKDYEAEAIKKKENKAQNNVKKKSDKETTEESYFINLEGKEIYETELIWLPWIDSKGNINFVKEADEESSKPENSVESTEDKKEEKLSDEEKSKLSEKKKTNLGKLQAVRYYYQVRVRMASAMLTIAEERFVQYCKIMRDIIAMSGIAKDRAEESKK